MIEQNNFDQFVFSMYRYWRIRIFYSIYIGYVFYFFTRRSFVFTASALINDLGLGKSDLGILETLFALTYGLSNF